MNWDVDPAPAPPADWPAMLLGVLTVLVLAGCMIAVILLASGVTLP